MKKAAIPLALVLMLAAPLPASAGSETYCLTIQTLRSIARDLGARMRAFYVGRTRFAVVYRARGKGGIALAVEQDGCFSPPTGLPGEALIPIMQQLKLREA